MQITNDIILSFIHCPYKAYRKSKSENGKMSDFEELFNELAYSQKTQFADILITENKLINTKPEENKSNFTTGFIVGQKFSNTNIEIILDVVEFIEKNKIIPILITPFEKVTRIDKMFIAFQATFLQSEFHFQVEHCKIVFGKNHKQTKFQLDTFTKAVKKNNNEINKILTQSNPPVFYRNNHCQICEFQSSCLVKLKVRDDLSLLSGLKMKEISNKNTRGIFSVGQLSYTFRPKKIRTAKENFCLN
jgi:predicted RecB family nuclease